MKITTRPVRHGTSACYRSCVHNDPARDTAAHRGPMRTAIGAAVGLAFALCPLAASAQRCPAMPGASASLGDADASVRLGYIQRRLRRGAARTRVWAYGWGAAYGAVSTVQTLRLATTDDYNTRMESAFAAGSAALGVASLVVRPPAIIGDSVRLHEQMATLRHGGDLCAVLHDAEEYLVRDASNQAFGIGLAMQSITIAYNIGLGLLFGLWLHDWTSAAITIGSGLAVSEAMILSQPTDAVDALRRYRVGDLRPAPRSSTSYWIVAPDVAPDHAGVLLMGAF